MSSPSLFVAKPVTVEALVFDGTDESIAAVASFVGADFLYVPTPLGDGSGYYAIRTFVDVERLIIGDYIVRHPDRHDDIFEIVGADDFAANYTPLVQ